MISGRSRAPARARNNLVFSWKLSGLCRSSAPLLPTNFVDEPVFFSGRNRIEIPSGLKIVFGTEKAPLSTLAVAGFMKYAG
jgi:hypothetical protein